MLVSFELLGIRFEVRPQLGELPNVVIEIGLHLRTTEQLLSDLYNHAIKARQVRGVNPLDCR